MQPRGSLNICSGNPLAQVLEAVQQGEYAVAFPALAKAQSVIDKNVKRGILHKNAAARRKSRLTMKVKALEGVPASKPVVSEPAASE